MLVIAMSFGYAVAQDDDKVIRVDTKLAEFEVLVEDRDGKPVHGLAQNDFRIFENGKALLILVVQLTSPSWGWLRGPGRGVRLVLSN